MEAAIAGNIPSEAAPAGEEIGGRTFLHSLQMLFSPVRTLASLKDRPRHFQALLLAAFYAAAVSSWIVQRIGLRTILQKTLQASQTVDADTMLANTLQHQTQILWAQAASTFVGTFITAYAIGLLLWLLVTVAGKEVRLKAINAVVAHAVLFYTVIKYTLFALSVLFSGNLAAINIKNPLATNAAFFIHTSSHLLQHLARSLDALMLAAAVLIILGLRSVTTRLSGLAASLIVLLPWLVYIVGTGLLSSSS